ncbi:MAG: S41 family peptidase [Terriglobia bacterium]
MKQSRRVAGFVFSTVLLGALLGGVYGRRVEATTNAAEDSDVQGSLGSFTKVYDIVEQNYADPVDADRAIFGTQETNLGAIPGMLRTLDPHSNFFDPRAFARLREDQEGKYYGVGMVITARPGKLGKLVTIVQLPTPGSPAFRAGLRPGDVIVKVDGKPTEDLNTTQVAEMLKGPKGTVVIVTIAREGTEEPLEFRITRDEIPKHSLDASFMLKPGIGYVHIGTFNENTNDELNEALKKLNEPALQGLVLDFRGNPGGLLQEAVEVSDHFVEKNQLIVFHNGRHSREKRYYATRGASGNDYPIVVLINRMTASAAEIVTGALQDHDRALVIGEPSFGKGLVQTVYPLSEKSGLALTTAHYYTPSGRLIQRDYTDVSLYDYYYHPQSNPTPHTEVRLTDGGREVYGGGGIDPDVKVSEPKLTPTQETLARRGAFFNFGKSYLALHKTIPRDFQVNDEVLDEFKQFLGKESIQIADKDFQDNLDFIKQRIQLQLVTVIYGENEAAQISVTNDYLVQKAMESLPQARELLSKAKKYMASKSVK